MTKVVFQNISKTYQKGIEAVKEVSFEAAEGDFLVLVGPSGCGKSTILRMIAGLEDISSGQLYFDSELMNDKLPRQRNVGMVFQNYALYPHLSVFENIAFPLRIKKICRKDINKVVEETAKMLGLETLLGRKPRHLSGGQRQRVALGRAIIKKPRVFLFDEPLSNLDATLRVQMRTEIQNLHRKFGTTSIYVTHDQVEAMTMGTKIVVLNGGIVQQIDTPEGIYQNPANLFVAGFIGSPRMNFFEGSIASRQGAIFIESETGNSLRLPKDTNLDGYIGDNHRVTIGIRPENIAATKDVNQSEFIVKITNVEYVGNEIFCYFQTNRSNKCLRCSPEMKYEIGDSVALNTDPVNIRIFDANGDLIRSQ